MPTAAADEFFYRFKWEIFWDAAFEDIQGLWEPLWLLRGYLKQPGMSELQSQELAERALRELQDEGLIYFFRASPHANPSDAADDQSCRLSSDEIDATLAGAWWRGTGHLPADHPNVWWSTTDRGHAMAENPPESIQAYWRQAEQSRHS